MTSPTSNTLQRASNMIEEARAGAAFRATVESNDTNQVFIIRDGESVRDAVSYPKLDGVTVVTGDEVLVLSIATRYVVIGKIVRN